MRMCVFKTRRTEETRAFLSIQPRWPAVEKSEELWDTFLQVVSRSFCFPFPVSCRPRQQLVLPGLWSQRRDRTLMPKMTVPCDRQCTMTPENDCLQHHVSCHDYPGHQEPREDPGTVVSYLVFTCYGLQVHHSSLAFSVETKKKGLPWGQLPSHISGEKDEQIFQQQISAP